MPWAPKLVISLAGRVLFHVASVSNYGVFCTGQVKVLFMSGYLLPFMAKSLLKHGRVDLQMYTVKLIASVDQQLHLALW